MPKQTPRGGELAALTKSRTRPPADWNGIYFTMEYVQLMGTNAAVLAGALGLPFSDEIGKLWHTNSSTKPLLEEWTTAYKNRFGHSQLDPKYRKVNPKQAMSLYKNPEKVPLFTRDTRPRIEDNGVTDMEITSLNMLWSCLRVMRACPLIFRKSKLNHPIAFHPSEILGALKLLQYIRTYKEKGQLKPGGARQQAIQPYFYAETAQVVEDRSIPSHEAVFGLPLEQMAKAVTEKDRDMLGTGYSTSGDAFEVERIIDKTLADSQGMARTGVVLPPIRPGERAVLINSLMKLDRFEQTGVIRKPREYGQSSQVEVARASAQAPSLIDACNRLNINIEKSLYSGVPLTESQATAMAWMMDQEACPVAGGILGDGCGMGKTRTALAFVHWAATITTGPYQPTVLLCPAHTLSVWYREARNFGTDIRVIILYNSKAFTDADQRKATVDKLEDLQDLLGSLDPEDLQTARTVVISSYSTWGRRVTGSREVEADERQENAAGVSEEEPIDGKCKREYFSHLAGRFARVICDEAHVVKNMTTQIHQGVKALGAPRRWFLTGTPIPNKMVDFCGYLNLLHSEDLETDANGPGYRELKTMDFEEPPYHLLSPSLFAAECKQGHQSAETGFYTIPPVMNMLCLRRDIGDSMEIGNGKQLTIGAGIPPMAIETIYLKFPPRLQEIHDIHYFSLVENLYTGDPDDGGLQGSDAGRCDWGVVRQLAHLSFCPRLFSFMRKVDTQDSKSGKLAKNIDRDDRGFAYFCQKTSTDPALTIPITRVHAARYLAFDCPKLRYLLKIFQDEGLFAIGTEQPRFVLFCH